MITEDYVSFETAKLLKEKGFDEVCDYRYYETHSGFDLGSNPGYTNSHWEDWYKDMGVRNYSAPTLQMAMKWLRLEHGLHVEPIPDCFDYKHGDIHDGWFCEITHLSDMSYDADYDSHKKHKTCEEACEDAIRFCLENLI